VIDHEDFVSWALIKKLQSSKQAYDLMLIDYLRQQRGRTKDHGTGKESRRHKASETTDYCGVSLEAIQDQTANDPDGLVFVSELMSVLDPFEKMIVSMLIIGHGYPEIARLCWVSRHTVAQMVKGIQKKIVRKLRGEYHQNKQAKTK
jgi:DNA-binding CsgD family transcriptional regulator